MATDINIQSLFPSISRSQSPTIASLLNTTYVGIDFGTSTTVASISYLDRATKKVITKPIWLNQRLADGTIMKGEKVPSVLAWYDEKLLIGQGAADLKHQLTKGRNVWYSFKMELGEDTGVKYVQTSLGNNCKYTIRNPKDATGLFFRYLKSQIERYVSENNLPSHIQYAVSIPASFEANQRKELVDALTENNIEINKQALIDEPNAAFLSYVHSSSDNPIVLPDNDNPKILVFDFGAGTCDISILELGKDLNGVYSKNLSISKFEKLGGDDIDKLIATEYLFPKILKENNLDKTDFRTPEKRRIITALLKAAEQLKIRICENIALQLNQFVLPEKSSSSEVVSVGYDIRVDTRKGELILSKPQLSYSEFYEVMKRFLREDRLTPYISNITNEEFCSVFSPIKTALKKANLKPDEIDYVLFIGGSAKNPYIQANLRDYFSESELLIPQDPQTHVSAGASIHSLIFNGFEKNIIQPITCEPLLVITKDRTPRVILQAGTEIPSDLIVIDDLVTSKDGQSAIELPICLGSENRMLYNIKMVSSSKSGFEKNTPIRLELQINADKLLLASATALGQTIYVEPINPFANKELTTKQRMVLKAEREANIDAEKNSGRPTESTLEALSEAYENAGEYLRAAETLELCNEIYPSKYKLNQIGLLYSNARYSNKALEYYEKAYLQNKNAVTAFNFAIYAMRSDKNKAKKAFQESLEIEPNKPHSLYEYGMLLERENNPEGTKMIKRAFEIWKEKFETNRLHINDYGWLSSVARYLDMYDFAQMVQDSKPKETEENLYNYNNLTETSRNAISMNKKGVNYDLDD